MFLVSGEVLALQMSLGSREEDTGMGHRSRLAAAQRTTVERSSAWLNWENRLDVQPQADGVLLERDLVEKRKG